jgi:hypothetical protein
MLTRKTAILRRRTLRAAQELSATRPDIGEPRNQLAASLHRLPALGIFAALFLAAMLFSSGSPGSAATSQPTAIAPVLHVISQLESSGDMVVLVNLTKENTLQLTGLDVATRQVVWQMPYSTSDLTAGVWPEPQIVHGVVIDLEPVNGDYPSVTIRGIDVATGSVRWQIPGMFLVGDVTLACAGESDFCIDVVTQGGAQLGVLSATSGHLIRYLSGPERTIDGKRLYETSAAAPTLEEVRPDGSPAWSRPISALFGSGFTLDAGWDIEPRSGLEVGSIGVAGKGVNESTDQLAPGGGNFDLAASKTVGFKQSNGEVVWSDSGMYDCGGTLQFLSTPVLCVLTGSSHVASLPQPYPTFKNVTLTFAGLDPLTGAVGWHQPVLNFSSILEGVTVPFLDGSHVVVRGRTGLEVVSTATGAVSYPSSSTYYWCENIATYKLAGVNDLNHGTRVAAPTFGSCSAAGSATTKGSPSTRPATVGVKAAGMFVWVSPSGLEAVPDTYQGAS